MGGPAQPDDGNEASVVHIFGCLGRFASDTEFEAFVVPAFDDEGDLISSEFMREVGLDDYEPMAIARRFLTGSCRRAATPPISVPR